MTHRLTKIDAHIAVWGAVAVAVTTVVGGTGMVVSALIGAVLAVVNWIAFRTLAVRMVSSSHKLGFGLFLAAKTLVVLGGIALLFAFLPLYPVAFIAGMAGLFLGILTSTICHSLKQTESTMER
jgi:hypothetical protein